MTRLKLKSTYRVETCVVCGDEFSEVELADKLMIIDRGALRMHSDCQRAPDDPEADTEPGCNECFMVQSSCMCGYYS